LARSLNFARLHVFRFSARRGTPAARMGQRVAETIKKERAATMQALSDEYARAYRRRFLGQTHQVLWEEPIAGMAASDGREWWSGLTGNYIRVYTASDSDLRNRMYAVRLVAEMQDGLAGEIVNELLDESPGVCYTACQ
jgi:threonylcarbamoyladenosine tRNA methylthiotransferase MtaB